METSTATPDSIATLYDAWRGENDPVEIWRKGLTPAQRAAVRDQNSTIIITGGSQSGKSATAVFDLLDKGHKACWYCAVSFDLFAAQPFQHFLKFLVYPGESIHKCPTTKIQRVDWLRPGIPQAIMLKNGQTITVKSYEQGRDKYQSKTLDHVVVDEECTQGIWDEINARFYASKQPRIVVAATPIQGEKWLDDLRKQAERGEPGVSAYTLKTLENPGRNMEKLQADMIRLKDRPDELKLRFEGIPYYAQGLVYPDGLWQPAHHEIEPHHVDPRDYTMYCCIDPGWRVCAALWVAVREHDAEFLVFRDYYGQELTVAENAQRIAKINATMRIERVYMDPNVTTRHLGESRERIIDLFDQHGVTAQPAARHEVEAGIQVVSDLLAERGPNGDARFHVFKTCEAFLRERRAYRRKAQRDEGDVGKENPEKREDHLMDCWRYLVMQGLTFRVTRPPKPPPGSQGDLFYRQRHKPAGDSL